jgi:effector-binding domain-containing protein
MTKNKYKSLKLDGTYFKLTSFYFLFTPIRAPYNNIVQKAQIAGYKVKTSKSGNITGILEKAAFIGRGWIAVEVEPESASAEDKNIFHFSGKFKTIEHKGSYKELGKVYGEIKKDTDYAKEFYNLYINDPKGKSENEFRTKVLFR